MMKKTIGLAMSLVLGATLAHAQWPQWRGPGRSGVAGEDQTLTVGQWGPKGPKLAWQSEEIPSGDEGNWSSPVVAGGWAYVFVAWETDVPLPTRTIARKDVPRLKQAPAPVRLTHDWPGYAGPAGTFTCPDQTPIRAELKVRSSSGSANRPTWVLPSRPRAAGTAIPRP